MAHLIENNTVTGKAEIAYANATPWHGLGQQLTQDAPIEVWRKEAGLDWVYIPRYPKLVVEKGPLSISAKIKSFLQLPRDIARMIYRPIRPLDISAIETPQGSNLFFRKP